ATKMYVAKEFNCMNKFYEIFRDLKQKIDQKEYPAGSLLQSELNLAQMYNVSRETIRKALNLLLESGYIQKQQGKGSIVLDIQRLQFPVSGLTSFKELQEGQQIDSQTIVIKNKTEKIPRYLAEQFHLPEDTDVVS